MCRSIAKQGDPARRTALLERFFAQQVRQSAVPHRLPARLVVSLTSYPKRFPTLHYTLRCLLNQTVAADGTVLWIAHEDRQRLPRDVLELQERGLAIACCEDLRQYKKIVPALKEYPDAFIVTADDDVYYPPDWLEKLVGRWRRDPDSIVAFRVHRIRLGAEGLPLPYDQWRLNAQTSADTPPSLVFPTGVAGVLYPPGVFHPDVTNVAKFSELVPTNDDIWLYWMWRMQGRHAVSVGEKFHQASWPESQLASLMRINVHEQANDLQIRNLIARFGAEVFHS
jgi:hypothetical protein